MLVTSPNGLPAWFETVRLDPDVESGNITMATFAIDFGAVLANDPNVPLVYRDPKAFWRATQPTGGLRRLLEEVYARLSGRPGNRVLQLRSPFGGGKSHVLLALYHGAKDARSLAEALPETKRWPGPGAVRVVGVDGEKFGPGEGMKIDGETVHTLWGALAAQLGRLDLMQADEQNRIAPGGALVKELLGDKPTLILLDEVLRYVERALAIPVRDSTLGRQTLDFLQTLTTEVANSSQAVVVYSLQASAREAMENVALLNTLDHLAARLDAKREPVVGEEILPVLQKRLLATPPPKEVAHRAAEAVAHAVVQWRTAEAPDEEARRAARDEETHLLARLSAAYPFHVALIDLMKERWAAIPDFQRTRGALRFLATVLYKDKKLGRRGVVVGPGDIPVDDPDVRNAFFTEVGQREPFQPVLEHDFIGPNARVKRIDDRLAKEYPALSSIRPASRLATTILMYSFGGLPREQGGETLPPGVTERELLEACLVPGLDSITAQSVLKRLREECLYLHWDGIRYAFKTIANVNLLIEEEAGNVRAEEIPNFVQAEVERRVAAATNAAVVWPQSSEWVPDLEPRFLLAYLPLEFAERPAEEQERVALELLTQRGSQPRRYRNGLGLAVPERGQIAGIRRAAKYLLAVDRVEAKRSSYKLSRDQLDQLKERRQTERSALEAGLRSLYTAVWLLKVDDGHLGLEKVDIGGRPMAAEGIHERLIMLLRDVRGKLFVTLKPQKMLTLLGIGTGEQERKGMEAKAARDTFFESPGLPRLTDERVIAETMALAIKDGVVAYALRDHVRAADGGYAVLAKDALWGRQVGPDEIDFDAGMVLLPTCLIPEGPPPPPGATPPEGPLGPTPTGPTGPTPAPKAPLLSVVIDMQVTKAQLFQAFKALGNLADKTGSLKVTVEAQPAEGADPVWFRNAVKEPLEEAGIPHEVRPAGRLPVEK